MSTRDIQKTINELYGTSVDDTMVSRITEKNTSGGSGMAAKAT
jgi:transposase-like protein